MKTLRFQGYSDDTFACSGPGIDVDHDDCAQGTLRAMAVLSGSQALIVTGQYCPPKMKGRSLPSWVIGIGKIEGINGDCKPIPDWPIRFMNSDHDYSPLLEIDAPDDVDVELIAIS